MAELNAAQRFHKSPFTYGGELYIVHLEFSLYDISRISVKNTSDPSLKEIVHGPEGYKVATNQELNQWFSSSGHPYQYVFALHNPRHNTQFIDLEPRYRKRMLIEFDDAQNFLSIIEQQRPEIVK